MKAMTIGTCILIIVLLGTACSQAAGAGNSSKDRSARATSTRNIAQSSPSACAGQQGPLRDQLREAQSRLNDRYGGRSFQLAAPTDISGFTAGSTTVSEPPLSPQVQVCLTDEQNQDRGVVLQQSVGGLGLMDFELIVEKTVKVQGGTGHMASGKDKSDQPIIVVYWDKGNVSYAVTGYNVSVQRVLEIADSVRPVS